MDEVKEVEVKPQAVLGIRRKGNYKMIPAMLKELCDYAGKNRVKLAAAPVFVCHEKTLEEVCAANDAGTADVEVCFPVEKKAKGEGDIKCYQLAGGKMAMVVHRGPYEDCGPAYQKLLGWIAKNGKKVTGPMREVYLNDPHMVKPAEILTEIYAPIA